MEEIRKRHLIFLLVISKSENKYREKHKYNLIKNDLKRFFLHILYIVGMSEIQFSKFMKSLVEEMENNKLSDKTIKNYIQRLYILNGRKKFTSLAFLRKHEDIIKYMKDNLSTATQKTYAGTISSVLKLKPNKVNEKLIKVYTSFINDDDMEQYKKSTTEKTEKQKENWISQAEIRKIKDELGNEASKISRKSEVNRKEYEILLRNMVLSLYVNQAPRRASDYALMRYTNGGDDKFNYYTDKNMMIFNNYKTSKTYGKQEIDVSKNKALLKDMKMYLKHRKPDSSGKDMLIVKYNGVPFNAVNDMTRTLNNIFGKKISTNMLRNIYVSDKYGSMKQGMIEDAEAMGHSTKTQQEIYNKG